MKMETGIDTIEIMVDLKSRRNKRIIALTLQDE
jgi:hypothetical protein